MKVKDKQANKANKNKRKDGFLFCVGYDWLWSLPWIVVDMFSNST